MLWEAYVISIGKYNFSMFILYSTCIVSLYPQIAWPNDISLVWYESVIVFCEVYDATGLQKTMFVGHKYSMWGRMNSVY